MNPYGASGDIFRSQANQSANSFLDPMNMAKLYPGWGINPAYQTPAYDAPYRPGYRGPDPYAAYQRPGFLGSLSQLYNPFANNPYWGDPVSNNQNAFRALGTRPMDAMAHAGQFLAPAAVFPVMQHMFGGMGQTIGSNLGRGFARGLGLNPIGGAMGAAGGFVGKFAIPMMLGMPVLHAMDQGIWQPYIRSRGLTDSTQDSFSGITFGSGGNPISGRGLSGRQSSNIATQIDAMGMRDMTFNAVQFGSIASAGMNAGLFDDVGSGGIVKRVSSIASQIKMIVAISKDPNIQTAISELAKLKMGGASIAGGINSEAAMAFGGMGMYASAAGMSVHRMMNTVGAQAQYMYQMNGLTPYLGNLAAGNAAAGFASASRMGILSPGQLARMGGVEGATQSAIAAQLSGFNTPFNMMQLANRFMGGGGGSSMIDTVSAFGGLASKGPLAMAGALALHGPTMISSQAGGSGASSNLENQAIALLRASGQKPGAGGKYSPEQLAAALQGMGLPSEQIISYIQMRGAQTNPGVVAQNVRAFGAQAKEQSMQAISQNMSYGGALNTYIARPIVELGQSVYGTLADMFGHSAARGSGILRDTSAKLYNQLVFDSTIGDMASGGGYGLKMSAIRQATAPGRYHRRSPEAYRNLSILQRLDEVARSGGEGSDIAQKLLASGFKGGNAKALFEEFLSTQSGGAFRDAERSLKTSSKVFDEIAAQASGAIESNPGASAIADSLNSLTGASNSFDSLRVLGQAIDIYGAPVDKLGLYLDDMLKDSKYSDLSKALGGTSDKVGKIREMVLSAGRNGLIEQSAVANASNLTLDQIIRSPGSFTSDPELQKQIAMAASSGNMKRVHGLINGEISRMGGGRNTRLDLVKYETREGINAAVNPLTMGALKSREAVMNSSSGGDYSTLSQASAAISSGSSLFFDGAVMFSSAVRDAINGKPKGIINSNSRVLGLGG